MPDTSSSAASASPPSQSDPYQESANLAQPENIARLLYILRVLLDFGRHLILTMEHRAGTPNFWFFAALFDTDKLPIIRAHLHRGILRAIALESLLLKRAAGGHDIVAQISATPGVQANTSRDDETFSVTVKRLLAERAEHDAPIDPDNLAAPEEIEAEVLRDPISRTIGAICRDLGVLPRMCTSALRDAVAEAVARYTESPAKLQEPGLPEPQQPQDNNLPSEQPLGELNLLARRNRRSKPTAAMHPEEMQFASEESQRELTDAATPGQVRQNLVPASALHTCQAPRFRNHRLIIHKFRHAPAPPRRDFSRFHSDAAIPNATGPPLRASMKLAA